MMTKEKQENNVGATDERIFQTLALYGKGDELKPSEFLLGAGGLFFELIGSKIDTAQISGRGMPKGPIPIEDVEKISSRPSARMDSISLYHSRENPQSYLFGWMAQARIDITSGLTLFCCLKELFPADYKGLLHQGESVAPFYYGTLYDLPFNRGPALFAAGGLTEAWPNQTEVELAERKRVSRWLYEMPKAGQGLLRDVFPTNLLTAVHAEKHNGISVVELIREQGLGDLKQICPGVHEWKPKDVKVARSALMKHDLIICK